MVLLQSEVQKTVTEQMVTMKINGKPISNDLYLLEEELIVITTNTPLVPEEEQMNMPECCSPTLTAPSCTRPGASILLGSLQECDHEWRPSTGNKSREFHTFTRVGMGLKDDLILKAIGKDYFLLEINTNAWLS